MTGSTATIAEKSRPPVNHARLRLVLYLLLGLALRLLLFAHFPALLTNDSPDYINAAYEIYAGFDFANQWLGDVRMPGYSTFLAVLYPLTGTRSDLLVLAQSMLGLLCVPLGWQIGRLLGSQRVADGLAIFFALNPIYLLLEHTLMTEALALFLLLVFTALALRRLQRPASAWLGFGAGALLGLAALVRVNVLPFGATLLALPLLAWAGDALGRRRPQTAPLLKTLLTALLLPLLGLALTLLPWLWRNHALYGTFSLSEHSDRSLLIWKTMSSTMDPALPLFRQVAQGHEALDFVWLNEFSPQHTTVEAEAIAVAVLSEQVQAHPDRHLRAMLRSALNHAGIFVEGYVPRDDRAMIAYWFHALVPNPAAVATSVPAVDEWLTFIPVTQPSAWTALWSAAGTIFLQALRPLLYIVFAFASLRFAFLIWRRQVRWNTTSTLAVAGLIAGCLATLMFHAVTLTGSDRFATLTDWAALAVVLYLFPHVIHNTRSA